MTDYNLGRVVGTDGTGIQSITSTLEASGRTKVVITLTTGTTEIFYIEKGSKGDTGTGIRTIELISTVGKNKNYRITFTNNSTFNYTIRDGEDAVCDTELDIDSENAVQNKVITGEIDTINTVLNEKYDKTDVLQLLIDYGLIRTADNADSVILAGDKEILSYVDGDILTLSATIYDEDNNVVPNKKVVFYKDEIVLDTRYTDANGVATYEYTSEGVGDVRFEASVGGLLSETYEIIDAYKYTSDGSGLDGTFTVTDGYITNCQSDTGISNFDLTGDFEFAYKYYNANSTNNNYSYNSLWVFGLDNDNGVYLGCEDQDRKIRVYNRNNRSTTSIQQTTNAYNRNEWIDVSIKYINGVWSITVGANTITYSKTFNPTFIHLFDNYTLTRIKEVIIKPL